MTSSKKNNHIECHKGSDLALIAIFPDSQKNTFTVISQENSIRNTKKGKTDEHYVLVVRSVVGKIIGKSATPPLCHR